MTDAFREAPAAKRMHHASRGLLSTRDVVSLVEAACAAHPELIGILVYIAILHDLGKIRAYDPTTLIHRRGCPGATCTSAHRRSRLRLVSWRFDPQLRLKLVHGILAHHGALVMARLWCP